MMDGMLGIILRGLASIKCGAAGRHQRRDAGLGHDTEIALWQRAAGRHQG